MASMSRHRPAHVAQGTWRSGALHVWGWNGLDAAPMAWMYSGFRHLDANGQRTGWHDTPVSYGAIGRLSLDIDGRPSLHASSVQLDAMGTAVWLSELPEPEFLSDSLAWFARVAELARHTVSAGRITPVIADEGPFTVARWKPVTTDALDTTIAALAASMPPICTAGSGVETATIYAQLVDGIARAFLFQYGWKADLGRQRKPEIQALRATFGALAKPDHVIRTGPTDEVADALRQLRDELDRHQRRLAGEPVVVPRIRLVISDDPGDPWIVRLELVDDRDSSRWCTANDVWDANDSAIEVAKGTQHLDRLRELVGATVEQVKIVPGLADLALEHEPTQIELELDVAEDFLDIAPVELQRMGIELIGPERLIRTRVNINGDATPSPADDRKKQFGKEALVEWKMVIGNEEVSEAEIARAEEVGATLLHTGHRWVRIDANELRRKRAKLNELQTTKAVVTPIELLRLANDESLGDDLDDLDDPDAERSPLITVHGEFDESSSADADWVRNLLAGLPDERLDETHESAEFVGELRHYQRRALSWLQFLAKLGLGGCLADDMGLGKTATTLAHLLERPGPHLVVCPLSVVRNWSQEAARFTPKLDVTIHHGANRKQTADDDALFTADPERQLVITTYGLLPRDLEHLGNVDWSTVVLDEAQMVKNPNTKAARAVRQVRAGQKLALTGTPVENRLSELWSILDAVNPGLLGSLQKFRERFGTPIERHGDTDAAARLRHITQPFILRRTKADKRLLPDLPDKIEQVAYAKLTREQATLYQQVVDQLLADAEQAEGMRRRGLVLAALMRLKQICNHPAHALGDGSRLAGRSGKLTRFDELVTDLLDAGERALVFTQFREMGELLRTHVDEQFHFDAPFLHGGVSRTGRDRMVDAFQDGSGPPILLVSLKAGGTGLNLTAASQVIHYDRWWNPAVEDQATDRAWRIGQDRTVNVHKLVCEGTVEERIGVVIDDKRKLAESVVGTGEAWLSELSTDELRDLVVLEMDS